MMNRIAAIFSVFLLFFLSTALSYGAETDCVDRVVAVVNDDVITLTELEKKGMQYFQNIKDKAPAAEQERALEKAREEVLSSMIDDLIVQQKAKEYSITVDEAEIDNAIADILSRNNATLEEFTRELAKVNISIQDYRENLRNQILQSKLISYEVRSRIVIIEENIQEYYQEEYTQDGGNGYYLQQIGINWKNPGKLKVTGFDTKEEVLKKAEEIRARVLAGENFADLAKSYSDFPSAADGGNIGLIKKGEMAPYMKDAILPMLPGEISPIVETDSTFQFFKLLSISEGDIVVKVPYESVKEEIRDILYRQEMEEQYQAWVDSLREQAYIKTLL